MTPGGWLQLPEWLAQRLDLNGQAKVVWCVIADRERRGLPPVGVFELGRMAGCDHKTARRSIVELKTAELLTIEPGPSGKANRYHATYPKMGQVQNGPGPKLEGGVVQDGPGSRPKMGQEPTPRRATITDHTCKPAEVAAVFARAGIQAPTDRILADEFPEASEVTIAAVLADVINAPVGVKVNTLRERLPAMIVAEQNSEPLPIATANQSKLMRELTACQRDGHMYASEVSACCSRCSNVSEERSKALCVKYGHHRTPRGRCTRCGDEAPAVESSRIYTLPAADVAATFGEEIRLTTRRSAV